MTNLNGGYVMIKHNATQAELQKAYATKKPVIVYDENNIGHFADICIEPNNDIYYLKTLNGALVRHNIELKKGTNQYLLNIVIYAPETIPFDTFEKVKDAIDAYGCKIIGQLLYINGNSYQAMFGVGDDYDVLYWFVSTEDGNDIMSTDLGDWPEDTEIEDHIIL